MKRNEAYQEIERYLRACLKFRRRASQPAEIREAAEAYQAALDKLRLSEQEHAESTRRSA